jgi:hypothetical protein
MEPATTASPLEKPALPNARTTTDTLAMAIHQSANLTAHGATRRGLASQQRATRGASNVTTNARLPTATAAAAVRTIRLERPPASATRVKASWSGDTRECYCSLCSSRRKLLLMCFVCHSRQVSQLHAAAHQTRYIFETQMLCGTASKAKQSCTNATQTSAICCMLCPVST